MNDAMATCARETGVWDSDSELHRFPQSVRIHVPRPQAPPEEAPAVNAIERQFFASMPSARLSPVLAAPATAVGFGRQRRPPAKPLAAAHWTAALSATTASPGMSAAEHLWGDVRAGRLNLFSGTKGIAGGKGRAGTWNFFGSGTRHSPPSPVVLRGVQR